MVNENLTVFQNAGSSLKSSSSLFSNQYPYFFQKTGSSFAFCDLQMVQLYLEINAIFPRLFGLLVNHHIKLGMHVFSFITTAHSG